MAQYLEETAGLAIDPGTHDCALFLAGAVNAQTGIDYAAPYRSRYTTERGGWRILRREGFEDHVALANHHLTRKSTAFLAAGDGAVVPVEDGLALGVVQGALIYLVGPTQTGTVPLVAADYGFAV